MISSTKVKAIVAALAVAALGAGAWSARETTEPKGAEFGEESRQGKPRQALAVSVAKPERREGRERIRAFGKIEAEREVVVSADVSGQRVVRLLAEPGEKVRKGQPLAELNTEFLKLERDRAAAELAQAQARVRMSRAEARRYESLVPGKGASLQEIESKRGQAALDSAQEMAARAAKDLAEAKLRASAVRAPEEGVIISRKAEEGGQTQAGQEMFRLIRKGRLEWRAEIPSSAAWKIKEGARAVISTRGGEAEGRVRRVSPKADELSGTFLAFVDADFPKGSAGTGARGFVEGEIRLFTVVPSKALRTRDGRSSVAVVDEEGEGGRRKARRAWVETGETTDDGMTEVSGLPEGVLVVLEGAGFVNDGDEVSVPAFHEEKRETSR